MMILKQYIKMQNSYSCANIYLICILKTISILKIYSLQVLNNTGTALPTLSPPAGKVTMTQAKGLKTYGLGLDFILFSRHFLGCSNKMINLVHFLHLSELGFYIITCNPVRCPSGPRQRSHIDCLATS